MRPISMIAVLIALTASPAAAGVEAKEKRRIYGFGVKTCAFWTEAKDSADNTILLAADSWVAGYISGRSLTGFAKYKNVIGPLTYDDLWARIESNCRENPNFKFGGVIDAIVRDIEERGADAKTGRIKRRRQSNR